MLAKSTDLESKKQLECLIDSKKLQFLDCKDSMQGNRVALASYPRSGNSLSRKILEGITGIYTGSDSNIHLDQLLQHHGLIGGGIYGEDSVWVTKTHYPAFKDNFPFEVDKVVCVVRNPIDVIPSLASLFGLLSHTLVPEKSWNKYTCWSDLFYYFHYSWVDYHNVLREQAKHTPTFFLTYEELMVNPVPLVKDLYCFLFDVESVDGTILEDRIVSVVGQGSMQNNAAYKLKAQAGQLYRSAHLYSSDQMKLILTEAASHLQFFDYAKSPTQTGSKTQWFELEKYDESMSNFKQHNKHYSKMKQGDKKTFKINHE